MNVIGFKVYLILWYYGDGFLKNIFYIKIIFLTLKWFKNLKIINFKQNKLKFK
jgi:hypothetical protein